MTINAVLPVSLSRSALSAALPVSTDGASPNTLPVQNQVQNRLQGSPATRQRPHRALDVPEILNHVGYFLSNKDAVSCVRVSTDWHQVFIPVLWEHVDTSKWSSWLRWREDNIQPAEPAHAQGHSKNFGAVGEGTREALLEPKTTLPLAISILQQALERNGHHIRTLTIVDLRTEGLVQLLDRCHRLETVVLWPDAFEEDVDDDDDDYQVEDDDDEEDHNSDEEEEEQSPTTRMTTKNEDCGNPIVNLLRRNRNLSKVEMFVGYTNPSGAFWRTLATLSATTTISPQDSSPLPRGLPPPPPKLPPCRGLRSFQSSLGLEIKRLDHLDLFLQMLQRLESLELENCYISELRYPDSLSKKSKKGKGTDSSRIKMTSSTLWFPHLRHVRFSRIQSLSVQSQFRILQACPDLESLDWRVPVLGFPVDEFCETLRRSYFSSTLTNTTPRWTRLTSLTLPESRLKDEELAKILRAMQHGLKCLVVRRSDFGALAFEALMKGCQNKAFVDQLLGVSARRRSSSSSSSSTLSSGSLSSESWKQGGGSGSEDEGDLSSESFASRLSWEQFVEQKGPDHWRTITHLDVGQCQAVTSVMTQCILRGCSKLESFDGYEIRAEDMIQFEEDEGTVVVEGDEGQFAMDVDDTSVLLSNKSGLASPPPSPLLDSPLSTAMPQPTFRRRLSQQHYGRSPLWTYSSPEKHDLPSRSNRRESNSEFIRHKATTRLWWSCDQIRHLDVHITGLGPYSDPRHKAVFEQLARLHQLVHLSICNKRKPTPPLPVPVSSSSSAVSNGHTFPVATMPPEEGYAATMTSLPSPPSSPPSEFSATLASSSSTCSPAAALFKYPRMGSHSSLSSTCNSAGNRSLSPIATTAGGGLDLRLRSGLSLLSPLKKLRVLRFKGLEVMMPETNPLFMEKDAAAHDRHRPLKMLDLEEEDIQWMVNHLWDLKFVEGRLHSDVEEQKRLVQVLESRGIAAWTSFNHL